MKRRRHALRWRSGSLWFGCAMLLCAAPATQAQETDVPLMPLTPSNLPATRPAILNNRWQEDWSALADPALRTEPLDSLKYIRWQALPRSAIFRSALRCANASSRWTRRASA